MGQGRARLKRKKAGPINQVINQPSELSQKIPGRTKIERGKINQVNSKDPMHSVNNANKEMTCTKPFIPDAPFNPGPVYRPPPKPIRSNIPISQKSSQSSSSMDDINPNINLDFGENFPFQEGMISATFQRPDKSFFQEPKELGDLINGSNIIQKIFTEKGRYRQNSKSNSEKGT